MNFQHYQAQFAAYIRNPEKNPLPTGTKPERMAMYHELFFNNINSFLISNFPVLHQLLDSQTWFDLVNDFFSTHTCLTPHFSEIPEEFLAYLQNDRKCETDLPFMVELAHYEWVEMALSIADSVFVKLSLRDFQQAALQLSPLACVLAYQFPVHQISPTFMPLVAPEHATFLVVYRDEKDFVQFLEITPLTYQLLQLIEIEPQKTADIYLAQLFDSTPAIEQSFFKTKGTDALQDFVKRGVIIGTN